MRPAGLALAAGLLAAGLEAGPSRPSVLLITIDTLRPDALGFVSGRNETPAIDAVARAGFRFSGAVTPVPLTLPAHASILSGLLPIAHGIHDNGQTLPSSVPTLAEQFRSRGYACAAFVSGFPLQRSFGLDRGFQTYDDSLPHGAEGWIERRAHETTAAALGWLRSAPAPWFAWVHYYDPHDPYDPPRIFWKPGPRGAYDGEVAAVDSAVGLLLDGLAARGPSDRLTVITADHGEALGEHEERTHGYFVYDSTMLVPLIFHRPGQVVAGQSPSAPRLVDVAPTILEAAGLPPLPRTDGVSLLPTLKGGRQPEEPAYLETWLPWTYFGWSALAAVRSGGFKLIDAPRPELYDLRADPGERTDRFGSAAGPRGTLLLLLERMAAGTAAPAPAADPEALERLRALGYVGSSGTLRRPPGGLPDPKDRIADRALLLEAEESLRAGRFAAALAAFDQVLAREPENRFATLRSGTALLKAGDLGRARTRLQRAVAQDPDRAEARHALADVLTRQGESALAAVQWGELARLQPRRFEAWFNLGLALLDAGRPGDAVPALRAALAVSPGHARARELLSRAEAAVRPAP